MAQSHTWKFYLTAGRTWGGPRISGASITAYSTQSGSTVLKALVTDASGYASYTLTGSTINPGSYYWRVNVGNIFGDYYSGKNVVGRGDTSGYYGIPSTTYNTSGIAIMSPSFNSAYVNANGTVTLYLFVVGQNVTISSSKFLTHFDVLSLIPPIENYLPSGTSRMTLNSCITESEMRDYDNKGAFKSSPIFYNTPSLITRGTIQEFPSFISGTSATPNLETTSLAFSYLDSTSDEKTIRVTVPTGFAIGTSITGTSKSYFKSYISQINSTTFLISVYPTNSNYGGSTRIASLVVGISKRDTNAWFGGNMTSATVALTQSYYQSGGSSGSTGGGGGVGGGGSQT
jgi:hypothetical protein